MGCVDEILFCGSGMGFFRLENLTLFAGCKGLWYDKDRATNRHFGGRLK